MGVVRVIVGIPLLALLIGVPGWLALRLCLIPPQEGTGKGILSDAVADAADCDAESESPPLPPWGRGRGLGLSPLESIFLAITLGVCIVGPVALALAMLGAFSLWLLIVVIALLSGAGALVARRRGILHLAGGGEWERGAWVCVGLLVVASALFLRPGETLIGGEDTGIYYTSGVAMARQGSIFLHDPILADIDGDTATVRHLLINTDARRFPLQGDKRFTAFFTSDKSGEIVPQFLHLWPAWLAICYSLFGALGPAFAAPVCGLLGVLGLVLLGRRLFGWPVGLIAGLFLTLNGIQVWFVRQSYTEAYQQFVLLAALLGLVLLEERRDPRTMRLGAVVAALALGTAALTHQEIVFFLPLVVAYGIALWLLRAWRRAHTWFFALFGALLAFALFQAGVFALGYTEGLWHHVYMNIWHRRTLLAVAAVVGIALLVVADRLRARWLPLIEKPQVGKIVRMALAVATAAYAVYGYILRPGILTGARGSLASYIGAPTPAGNAANLVRLGWYWSPLGVLLIAIGATLLIGRDLNRLTGGLLAVTLIHTVIFVNETYTDDKYIYALRHYVPVVLPAFSLFAAYAVWNGPNPRPLPPGGRGGDSLWMAWRSRKNGGTEMKSPPLPPWGRGRGLGRVLGIAAACLLVLFFVATRAVTWTVRRYAGMEGQLAHLAAQFPENSLLLFSGDRDEPHLLATPLQFIYGRAAFVVSTNNPRGDLIENWLLRERATHPVYVLMGNDGGKLFLPHTRLVPDERFGPAFTVTLEDFESLQLQKPHNAQQNTLRYTVYRLEPLSAGDSPLGSTPLTIAAGQADERYDVAGFYGIERDAGDATPYRWTGPAALLRIPWTPALAKSGGTVTLRLAGGKRPTALGSAHVTVSLDPAVGEVGPDLGALDLAAGFVDFTLTIPPNALPASDDGTAILRINACLSGNTKDKDPKQCSAWSPQDYAQPGAPVYDARILGVQVQSVAIAPR